MLENTRAARTGWTVDSTSQRERAYSSAVSGRTRAYNQRAKEAALLPFAIAGYGIIGILVIILLVVLIFYFMRRA